MNHKNDPYPARGANRTLRQKKENAKRRQTGRRRRGEGMYLEIHPPSDI